MLLLLLRKKRQEKLDQLVAWKWGKPVLSSASLSWRSLVCLSSRGARGLRRCDLCQTVLAQSLHTKIHWEDIKEPFPNKHGWESGQQQQAWLGFCENQDGPGIQLGLGSLFPEAWGCEELWGLAQLLWEERSTAELLLYVLLFYLSAPLAAVSHLFPHPYIYWLEWFHTAINFARFISSLHTFFFFLKQTTFIFWSSIRQLNFSFFLSAMIWF